MKLPKINYYTIGIIIVIIIIIINIVYSYATYFEKNIKIINIFKISSYKNNSKNAILDDNNNVYLINNSILYGFFTESELYSTLNINKTYKIKGYGKRIPFIGMYPNIIDAKLIK
jgi:hypothetical protein